MNVKDTMKSIIGGFSATVTLGVILGFKSTTFYVFLGLFVITSSFILIKYFIDDIKKRQAVDSARCVLTIKHASMEAKYGIVTIAMIFMGTLLVGLMVGFNDTIFYVFAGIFIVILTAFIVAYLRDQKGRTNNNKLSAN